MLSQKPYWSTFDFSHNQYMETKYYILSLKNMLESKFNYYLIKILYGSLAFVIFKSP